MDQNIDKYDLNYKQIYRSIILRSQLVILFGWIMILCENKSCACMQIFKIPQMIQYYVHTLDTTSSQDRHIHNTNSCFRILSDMLTYIIIILFFRETKTLIPCMLLYSSYIILQQIRIL